MIGILKIREVLHSRHVIQKLDVTSVGLERWSGGLLVLRTRRMAKITFLRGKLSVRSGEDDFLGFRAELVP